MSRISLHPGLSVWLLLLLALATSGCIAVFYRRAFRALRPGQWVRLYVLRMVAVAIVLLLLFRPVFTHQSSVRERRSLVFLVDRSASMGIRDDPAGASRLQQVIDRVNHWQTLLAGDFRTQTIAFADGVEPLAQPTQLGQLSARGVATSLTRAMDAAAKLDSARDLAAIVLFSDGIHNSAGDPRAVAARLGVPIYTVGIGEALRERSTYRDIRVMDVDVPDRMSVQNRTRIKGFVDAVGFPGRVVTASLHEDDLQVAEQELTLDNVDGAQEVTFEFTATKKGLHRYTVRVPSASGERITENNERTDTGLVVEARMRVLYIEGTLRAEYGAVVGRFLSKDPDVEYCGLVQTRPNVFMQRSNIDGLQLTAIPDTAEQWDRFDVIILGDLDSSFLPINKMELIRERVRAGAGLLVTGGYHSLGPGGYQGTPLEEVLPLWVGDRAIGQISEPFQPRLTLSGRQHPIFANIRQFFASENAAAELEGLPALEGCVRILGAKPAATVLAIHPVERTSEGAPLPLMAVAPFGKGRGAVFTGDTTRNWHQLLRSQERETPFLRFWGQTVRWLAGRNEEVSTEAGVVATTDKAVYEPESDVTVTAVVRGRQGEATSDAVVKARVTGPDIQQQILKLAPVAGPAGNFQGVFKTERSGRFELAVTADLADGSLSAEPLVIEIGHPNLEFDRLDLDEQTLTAIAAASGGRYAPLRSADRLIEQLDRARLSREVQYEIRLSWPPLLWCAFVGVLTSEWLLRRRYSLR